MIDKGIPRKGYEVFSGSEKVGTITSGTQSPSLEKGIGLAYINTESSRIGSILEIEVRNKKVKMYGRKGSFFTLMELFCIRNYYERKAI